ncbi:unnamed protein product [Soboliphyme baturini]|uniref:RB_A domain-containing protein n=1 Tax=Soboliphyme baturini TaxID=241478 RepID=A0A183ILU8_9BILA|nr:unnamed protein product [Soboliphyme baturini]
MALAVILQGWRLDMMWIHVYLSEMNAELLPYITKLVSSMGESLILAWSVKDDTSDSEEHDDEGLQKFGIQHRHSSEMLYYRFLEKIIGDEKERSQSNDIANALKLEQFHRSLFACSAETVRYLYGNKKSFPWLLGVFNIQAFHFYKIIEVVIRADLELNRDTVKHLNDIEERVLEELAWTKDSVLWSEKSIDSVPPCSQVSLPSEACASVGLSTRTTCQKPGPSTDAKSVTVTKPVGSVKRRLDLDPSCSFKVSAIPVRATPTNCENREPLRSGSTLPIPAVESAPPTPNPHGEERGDLIKFYNSIFVARAEHYVKRIRSNGKKSSMEVTAEEGFDYRYKDLKTINNMMDEAEEAADDGRKDTYSTKRLLNFDIKASTLPPTFLKKWQEMEKELVDDCL